MRVAVECEHAVRGGIIDDCVRVLRGRNVTEDLERRGIEHHDGAVVSGRRKSVMRRLGQRDAVRSMNVGDLAQEFPVPRIDHHHTILARDEHPVVRSEEHTSELRHSQISYAVFCLKKKKKTKKRKSDLKQKENTHIIIYTRY